MRPVFIIPMIVLVAAAGCAPVTAERAAEIRAALDRSSLTLQSAVALAQDTTGDASGPSIGVIAVFSVEGYEETAGEPGFSVTAVPGTQQAAGNGKDVRIDAVSGDVVGQLDVPGLETPCPDELPLRDAIATAEDAVGGDAITIQPDDDGQCNRQLQVLRPDSLWSVKMDQSGRVLEEEEDDDAD